MIAMLGMYDMPAIQGANDRFWTAIRARLGAGPERLNREADFWDIWQSPELLLAQTCGLPYRTRLHDRVALVGTPDYALPDCAPGQYRSVLVIRKSDSGGGLAGRATRILAYNDPLSQSGWAAPVAHLAARGLRPAGLLRTGGHAASARAVAEGRADIAGLDALSWALLNEHDPVAESLRVVDRTAPTPGLPYITAAGRDPAPVAAAIAAAIGDLAPADRAALHLRGLVLIPKAAYLTIPNPPPPWAN